MPFTPEWRLSLLCDRLALHIPLFRKKRHPTPKGQWAQQEGKSP